MRTQLGNGKRIIGCVIAVFIAAIVSAQTTPIVTYQGRPIRFVERDRPYYVGRIAILSMRPVCVTLGAKWKRTKDGRQWTISRGTDRLDFTIGESWFVFNGARMTMGAITELHANGPFVPYEMLQTISGGGLDVKSDSPNEGAIAIYLDTRVLHFKQEESPFRRGGTTYVAVRPTATFLDSQIKWSGHGQDFTLIRSRDRISYELGTRSFTFNGEQKALRSESIAKGKVIYVPIEIFQALVGDQIRSR